MITIEEEKIAELMFDIWHKSNDLKNPIMVGEYIADKLKQALILPVVVKSVKEKEKINFKDWLKQNGYTQLGELYFVNTQGLTHIDVLHSLYEKE